jgi:hypothetical protein
MEFLPPLCKIPASSVMLMHLMVVVMSHGWLAHIILTIRPMDTDQIITVLMLSKVPLKMLVLLIWTDAVYARIWMELSRTMFHRASVEVTPARQPQECTATPIHVVPDHQQHVQ